MKADPVDNSLLSVKIGRRITAWPVQRPFKKIHNPASLKLIHWLNQWQRQEVTVPGQEIVHYIAPYETRTCTDKTDKISLGLLTEAQRRCEVDPVTLWQSQASCFPLLLVFMLSYANCLLAITSAVVHDVKFSSNSGFFFFCVCDACAKDWYTQHWPEWRLMINGHSDGHILDPRVHLRIFRGFDDSSCGNLVHLSSSVSDTAPAD